VPYRDDLEAATARRDALAQDLTRVSAELDDANRRVEEGKRRFLPLLDSAMIATPCHEPWDTMKGDDKVRFCGSCEKHVYNLSAMTSVDAESLLEETGGNLCARFYRRPDGTILTADCPVVVKRRRRRRVVIATVAAVAGAFGAVWSLVDQPERAGAGTFEAVERPQPPVQAPETGGMSAQELPPPVVVPPPNHTMGVVAPNPNPPPKWHGHTGKVKMPR
jgi:hypothetical protein